MTQTSEVALPVDMHAWLGKIERWARELGFSQLGVSDVKLQEAESGLQAWLAQGWHGQMHYMAAHGTRRTRPADLVEGTCRVISVRMDYLPRNTPSDWAQQERARTQEPQQAVISMYARGRDYHKVLRQRLQQLCVQIETAMGMLSQQPSSLLLRPFVDSAPVMEVALATKAGIGWRGKHTLLLHRESGSMFFLGEIYTNLPLPLTRPTTSHCGSCQACMDACPTRAIAAPYRLDARACISYLTIEHEGAIPVEFRRATGNRIYGCDECQTACPWNKYARRTVLPDFDVRAQMQGGTLLELFAWDEATFLSRTAGSAIRRIGYQRWTRNLVVALGNALRTGSDTTFGLKARAALLKKYPHVNTMIRMHIDWALEEGCGE